MGRHVRPLDRLSGKPGPTGEGGEKKGADDEARVCPQGTAGIVEPYLALIACTTFLAISLCVAALGWMPSHENASPKGFAEQGFGWPWAFVNAGNGAT